ncbi:MAG: NINE protein [Saprospiraceae bacterium]|nr:NINE protein [Saprospiraceae bacterium]
MTSKRQLAAIMYCDLAGFSSLLHSDPSLADEVRERQHRVMTEAHKKYNGNIIQHFGDSTLSIFNSAAEAVECAYFLQLEMRRSPEIPLRIGIHTGEIVQDENGVYGEGLNVASRVERMGEPGSILLTDKVHDDIRSHPWIITQSIGAHKLDDLEREKELFVVTNRGLSVPSFNSSFKAKQPVHSPQSVPIFEDELEDDDEPVLEGKKKYIASLLALFLGPLGGHRFYLGQRFRAILYIIMTSILVIISAEEHAPFVLFMFLLSILDAVLLGVMPRSEFDLKFNEKWQNKVKGRRNVRSRSKNATSFKLLKEAVQKFESKSYENAIVLFDRLVAKDKRNSVAHFYLACCFSMLRDSENAFYHLEAAVQAGFDDIDKIEREKSLKYIRSQSRYQAFRHTYLNVPMATLPSPTRNLLDSKPGLSTYEKIEALGEKLASGELTTEEFEAAKVRLLNN